MPEAPQIDAPQSLSSFFPDSDSENDDDQSQGEQGKDGKKNTEFDQCYETQVVNLNGCDLLVRQYAYHSHNANRVWPGTFNLLDYLLRTHHDNEVVVPSTSNDRNLGSILELGTATGLLSIRLSLQCLANQEYLSNINNQNNEIVCTDIVTSDVDDELGEVEDNVIHNFKINRFIPPSHENDSDDKDAKERIIMNDEPRPNGIIPPHIPHTWGTGWLSSAKRRNLEHKKFDTIIASDILLYVSSYDALVQTLIEIFDHSAKNVVDDDVKNNSNETDMRECVNKSIANPSSATTANKTTTKKKYPIFVMSWNRRMKESQAFFEKMEKAGFTYKHEGKCVYTFRKEEI